MRTPELRQSAVAARLFQDRLIADSIAGLGSLDFVLGDVDR